MKKEHAFLFIGTAFIAGIVVGVILTVHYEEEASTSSAMKPPFVSSAPAVLPPDIQRQITSLQSALKNDPRDLKALIQLGNLYFDTDQVERAIESYAQALEIDPKNADVRTDIGIMYRRKGDPDRAIAEFKKAAENNPQHINSRYNLGIVLLHDKGDIKGAVKAWEDYLQVEPTGPRAENIRKQMGKMRAMIK